MTGGNIMIRVIGFPRQEFKAVEKGAESKDLWEGAGCLLLLHDILSSVRCSCCWWRWMVAVVAFFGGQDEESLVQTQCTDPNNSFTWMEITAGVFFSVAIHAFAVALLQKRVKKKKKKRQSKMCDLKREN